MGSLIKFFKQTFFIPAPRLTEQNLPDQTGRVFVITGGYAGVGYELSKILFAKNGIVYVAGRSSEKAEKSILKIKETCPESKGKIEFMKVDLADLPSIKPAVEAFAQKESRLDVLVNNAGVMTPPLGSETTQGYEQQIGTNCLGHFLLAHFLTPLLERTASTSPAGSVRVAWAASFGVELSPKTGIPFDKTGSPEIDKSNNFANYTMSKVGDYFLSSQFAKRHPISNEGKGVVSISFNPGHLRTELQRHSGKIGTWIVDKLFLNPAIMGAYTELWAGWSEGVRPEDSGRYIWPWGRFGEIRADVEAELKDGGKAEQFWNWCLQESKAYLVPGWVRGPPVLIEKASERALYLSFK